MTWARRAIVPRPNVGAGVARISNRPLTRERSICSATQALQFKRGQRKRSLTEGPSEFRADRLDLLKAKRR